MQQSISIPNEQSVSANFWRFAIPSVVAMLVSGLYQVIDGIFVGHYVGAQGLAGINMSIPVMALVTGVGLMIGMGGGSMLSMYRGENNDRACQNSLASALLLVVLLGLLISIVLQFGDSRLIALQGAEGEAQNMAQQYLGIMSAGALVSIAASALPLLVRNDDKPNLATLFIVLGALLNIGLDYLFLAHFSMGLRGAAIATLIAQSVTSLCCVHYFFSAQANTPLKGSRFEWTSASRMIQLGSSSLMMFVYFGFVMALHNKLFMSYASATHVAAFAIVGYLGSVYYFFAEGVASGLQPPVSYYLGAKQINKIAQTVTLAFSVTVGSGIAIVVLLNLFPEWFIAVFSSGDEALMQASKAGVRWHLAGIFLDGFLFISAVYFMAVGEAKKALFVSAGNMLIQLPFLWLLPQFIGVTGIWISVPLSNLVLSAVVLPMLYFNLRDLQQRAEPAPSLVCLNS
ncbi:MATE family efflux transporter [Agarivorans sp. Toyoura001]|uniref:MATE family efflux transporter n=1 Tax=Agarivorans sp. Toyoura001 TaxID=2283141 RepID=UPI0010E55B71|nr:MATE family efflux transporter [Agarivorans sp. Toyoura001]GDY24509.1 MATE family efflux transporter [Agarivorans sp. Toyoura001]